MDSLDNNTDIQIPEILPPTEDGIFKTLLTHPDYKPVLIDLISTVIGIPVLTAEVKNNELPLKDTREKQERLDVNCILDGGRQANIEMQTEAMEKDTKATGHKNIKARCIFNLCDLHSSQEGKGISYKDLMQSYQITFANYTILTDRPNFINRFSFRDKEGTELHDSVCIVFIELTKLKDSTNKPVSDLTPQEMWALFFANADEPKYKPLIDEIASKKGEIKMANELLQSISQNEDERFRYLSRKKFRMDMEHNLIESFREGEAKGIALGIAEGEAKIVRSFLAGGMSANEVAAYTGLTIAEIEELRTYS